jgi:hypothetical protein
LHQHLLVWHAGTVVGGVVGFGAGAAVVGGAVTGGAVTGGAVTGGAVGAGAAGAADGAAAGAGAADGAAAVVGVAAGVEAETAGRGVDDVACPGAPPAEGTGEAAAFERATAPDCAAGTAVVVLGAATGFPA